MCIRDSDVTGDVGRGANVTVTATASSGTGIVFRDKINADNASSNDRTLTLDSGTNSTISLLEAIGDSQALAGLTITQSDGATIGDGGQRKDINVNDGSGIITITDTEDGKTVTLDGAVTAGTLVTGASGYNLVLNSGFADTSTYTSAVTFQNTGTLLLLSLIHM